METIRFDELNLDPRILRAVTDMGFEAASPIQALSLIHISCRKNLIFLSWI